ncbi:MAG: arsinothricin resistance N-acetyltransferase ArsN1 family B [Pseudomonadota bacterium]
MQQPPAPLTITPAVPARDGAAIAALYAHYVTQTAISFEETAPDASEMAQRIASTQDAGYPYLVAREAAGAAQGDGTLLGYAYASAYRARSAYRFSVEVSVYMAGNAQRAGTARALYERLFEPLRARDCHAMVAGITLPNEASVGFHEAMGFTPVGIFREVGLKFGTWHDVGYWQRTL